MAFKNWFGGGSKEPAQEYTIDDLIVLERYDEAVERLRAKLKTNPQDLHSHLKLADVHAQLRQFDKAVDEYGFVADEYAADGFYDKGIALLSRAAKLAPLDPTLPLKIDKLQREKSMEHVRALALEGLRAAGGRQDGTSALELKRYWHNLAGGALVQQLPGEQLKRLFSSMHLIHLEQGEVIAEAGHQEPFLLVLVRGIVEAVAAVSAGREMILRTFGPGDVLGEAALLERAAWPIRLRTAEPSAALRLDPRRPRAGAARQPRSARPARRPARPAQRPRPGRHAAPPARGVMAILPIRIYPDPVLRVRCPEVVDFDPELARLAADMVETMVAAPGIGLAAPQVGVEARLAVVDLSVGKDPQQLHVLVNPRLVEQEGMTAEVEGCLSLPGLTDKVDRPLRVKVAAQDLAGAPLEVTAEDWLARALCHEIDHLDGVLFTDHLRGLRRERAKRQLKRLAADYPAEQAEAPR